MRWYCLGLLFLVGCGLLGVKDGRREVPLEVEAYVAITLNGQPWRPDSALGTIELRPPEAFGPGTLPPPYLMLVFVLRDPTPALPFYKAKLSLDVWARPPRADTTYYLFNTDPGIRELVAQGRAPAFFWEIWARSSNRKGM